MLFSDQTELDPCYSFAGLAALSGDLLEPGVERGRAACASTSTGRVCSLCVMASSTPLEDRGDGQHVIDGYARLNMSGRNVPQKACNEFRQIYELFSKANPVYDRFNAALLDRSTANASGATVQPRDRGAFWLRQPFPSTTFPYGYSRTDRREDPAWTSEAMRYQFSQIRFMQASQPPVDPGEPPRNGANQVIYMTRWAFLSRPGTVLNFRHYPPGFENQDDPRGLEPP